MILFRFPRLIFFVPINRFFIVFIYFSSTVFESLGRSILLEDVTLSIYYGFGY